MAFGPNVCILEKEQLLVHQVPTVYSVAFIISQTEINFLK